MPSTSGCDGSHEQPACAALNCEMFGAIPHVVVFIASASNHTSATRRSQRGGRSAHPLGAPSKAVPPSAGIGDNSVSLAGGFAVLKRSWDETPFWMKD